MRSLLNSRRAVVLGLWAALSPAAAEIVGGKSIPITQTPWQLWLGNCGASWLGGRNVLTAQHCINSKTPSNTWVCAGITRRNECTTDKRIPVAQIIKMAPNTDLTKDLAILKLAADLPANTRARPIRYATPADVSAGYTNRGVDCMATGWGRTAPGGSLADSLQMVMSKISNTPTSNTGVIRWGGQGGSQHIGACNGDSGGPMVVKNGSGEWILVGVASYISSFCGDPNGQSSYARVSSFTSWLQQNGVNQPSTTPVAEYRIAPRGGDFFTLDRPQWVTVSVLDLNGALLSRDFRQYGAGRHAIPAAGQAGGHILRLTGTGLDARHRINPAAVSRF